MAPEPVRITPSLLAAAIALVAGVLTFAHSEPNVDDHEEEDARYLERLRTRPGAPGPSPSPGASPASGDPAAEFLAEAERLIRDPNFSSRASDHFRVMTDDPRVDTAAALALLDGFRAAFESFWTGRLELRADGPPASVFLYYSLAKYQPLLTGQKRFSDFRPAGHYRMEVNAMLLHTDAEPPGELPDVLVHEASHQQIDTRLLGPEAPSPLWLAEGLASYFGHTARGKTGAFEFGEVGGKRVALVRDAGTPTPRVGEVRREAARDFLRKFDAAALDTLLREDDPRVFYGGDPNARYGTAWVAVHYFFHGESGRRAEGFARWLAEVRAGRGDVDGLYRAIGLDSKGLRDALLAHANRMRPR